MTANNKNSIIYSICVSGAAVGPTIATSRDKAMELGRVIAKKGQTITTGATVGLPYYAAMAAVKAGGKSIGFSPAASLSEHLNKYRLPFSCYDFINFTGMHYVGRDLYLVQSSDAVITVGGRFGSLHEFTSALESNKPCGILTSSGGTADVIPNLMNVLEAPHRDLVVYSDDPEALVDMIIKKLDEKNKVLIDHLKNHEHFWYLNDDEIQKHRSG
ncbi:MAG TPA: hypothetical protein VMR76_01170 [Candidatus Saccharimonadia bacterium]|nr:hypothetical protein [Candidatus Saccharimonadia bacterium]